MAAEEGKTMFTCGPKLTEIPEHCEFCKAERAGISDGRVYFKCGTNEWIAGTAVGRAINQSANCQATQSA